MMWESVKKPVYIALKDGYETDSMGNEYPVYKAPVMYRMDIQPLSSYLDITTYGKSASMTKKAVVGVAEFGGKICEDDVGAMAYLDGKQPIEGEENGFSANYEIVAIRQFNRTLHIYFEKRKGG